MNPSDDVNTTKPSLGNAPEDDKDVTTMQQETREGAPDCRNHEETFVVTLPRSRHSEPLSIQAKLKEIDDFKVFDVYEEVNKPSEKDILGTQWVLTEKEALKGKPTIRKARLCILGNHEKNIDVIPTESPTVAKSSIRLLLMEAARHPDWFLRVSDVTRAFLQTAEIQREVYVKPPKEAKVDNNKVWKLKRPVYGLADASRGFYINQSTKLVDFGMEVCKVDPAFFFYHGDGSTMDSHYRDLSGMVATHVDDSLNAGDARYRNDVEGPMTEVFEYGSHENLPFRYVGINMHREEECIILDQDHYVENLEVPDISKVAMLKKDDTLPDQSYFRSSVAKLQMISITSRPDLCYDVKMLSRLYGKATKLDFQQLVKLYIKVKTDTTKMTYNDLGNLEDWVIVIYSDASLKKMPDTVSSCGGRVILMVNKVTNKAAVLTWKSKQLKRVVHSSMAAEAMSLEEAIAEANQLRLILKQMHGSRADDIPAIALIDCQDLYDSIHNLRPVEDKRILGTIIEIKEAVVKDKIIQELRLVDKNLQIADGLTKPNMKCQGLMEVLQKGTHIIPGGSEVMKNENIHTKTWVQLNEKKELNKRITIGSSVICDGKEVQLK